MKILFVCILVFVYVDARKRILPLREDRRHKTVTSKRKMGCQFGDDFYELLDQWHPNLGPPFGLMTCIQCKCMPTRKRRRIIGRVICKNVADLCPKPNCANPVLAPNACCKLCPNQTFETNVFGDKRDRGDYTWDSGYQEYMSLLTGRFKDVPVLTEGVGRAYLTLYHKNLHYSIIFENLEETPTAIQILNEKNAILFERSLDGQYNRKKICGVWNNIPRVFGRALRKGHLSLVLITAKQINGAIGGHILKAKRLNKESFSSLLTPTSLGGARSLGYGGVAVIDVQGGGNSLQIHIKFNASLDLRKDSNGFAYVFLEKNDGRRKQIKSYRVALKTQDNLYTLDVTVRLGSVEQRWLSRGRLLLSVRSPTLTPEEFVGVVTPKQSCDVYQAALTSEMSSNDTSVGYALISLTEDSSFKYTIRVTGVNDSNVSGFSIDRKLRQSNRHRQIAQSSEKQEFLNGWTKGYLRRQINVRDVDLLSSEKLNFEVYIDTNATLRGKLKRILYSDSIQPDQSEPSILAPTGSVAGALALGWFGRPLGSRNDNKHECALSFTLALVGLTHGKPKELKLSICNQQTQSCSFNFTAKDHKVFSDGISDLTITGIIESLPSETWKLLSMGQASLRLSTSAYPLGIMIGNLSVIPNRCYRQQFQRDRFVSEDSNVNLVVRTDCLYQEITYKNGQIWHATHQQCTMCHCQQGRTHCDRVVCPITKCDNPLKRTGECCPSCPPSSPQSMIDDPGCYWEGDKQWHAPSTVWHPYIPPSGFSKCALCTCQPHNHQVTCSRAACPELDCAPELRYRENWSDCCRKCRKVQTTTPTTTTVALVADAPVGDCHFQHKVFHHGDTFSPSVAHVAHLKCVLCICEMGHVTCRRAVCKSDLPCDAPERAQGCCKPCKVQLPWPKS